MNNIDFNFIASMTSLLIAGYLIIRSFWKYPNRNIVYGYPILGSALTEITQLTIFTTLLKYAQLYGPIYDIFIFSRRLTVLSDPEDIKEVLSKRPKIFRRIKLPGGNVFASSDGIIGAEGADWSRHRRMIAPPFSKKSISYYLNEIWKHSEHTAKNLHDKLGQEMDTLSLASSFTIEIIGLVAFGISKETYSSYFYKDEFKLDLKSLLNFLSKRILFALPDYIWKLTSNYKYQILANEAVERLNKVCFELIQNERNKDKIRHSTNTNIDNSPIDTTSSDGGSGSNSVENKTEHQTFLQSLVRAQGENKFTDNEVAADLRTIFIAGTDTTSIGIVWTLYFLTQYPSVLQEIRKEIDDVMELERSGTLSKDDLLDKLRLTSACFKEAMRLKGPLSQVGVQMTESTNLPSYTLKSGRIIYATDRLLCSIDALKYDERTYEQATEFIPSRWLTTDTKKLAEMEGNLLTFGYGPNICPGMYLSMAEAPIFLCHILYRYDITLACAPSEIYRIAALTISPNKMPIIFTTRKV